MADEHVSVPDSIRANAATHWTNKPVFYSSSVFFIFLTLSNKQMHMKMTGTFAGCFNTNEVNSPKWVLLFFFFLDGTTFFFRLALLFSGTHYNNLFLIFCEASDLIVNAAGGFTLWGSGHVDDRHSTGEWHWATRLYFTHPLVSSKRQQSSFMAFRSSLEIVEYCTDMYCQKWNKAHSRASMLTSAVQRVSSEGFSKST